MLAGFAGRRHAVLAHLDGIGRRGFAVDRHAQLLADDLELVDGGGALHVGGDEHGPPLRFAGACGPACRRSSFCRSLAARTA